MLYNIRITFTSTEGRDKALRLLPEIVGSYNIGGVSAGPRTSVIFTRCLAKSMDGAANAAIMAVRYAGLTCPVAAGLAG